MGQIGNIVNGSQLLATAPLLKALPPCSSCNGFSCAAAKRQHIEFILCFLIYNYNCLLWRTICLSSPSLFSAESDRTKKSKVIFVLFIDFFV